MKFFIIIILISSCLTAHSAYPDDVQDTLGPSDQLYYRYSILHILSPKSADPSTFSSAPDIPVVDGERPDLSISLPKHLYSKKVDTLHACGHDLCSLPLSISERFLNCIFELSSLDTFAEYLPSEHDIFTWFPKLYGHSSDLLYVNSSGIHSYRKSIKFIESKVPAINCRVLTIPLG